VHKGWVLAGCGPPWPCLKEMPSIGCRAEAEALLLKLGARWFGTNKTLLATQFKNFRVFKVGMQTTLRALLVRACVHACVRVCVRVCVCACVRATACAGLKCGQHMDERILHCMRMRQTKPVPLYAQEKDFIERCSIPAHALEENLIISYGPLDWWREYGEAFGALRQVALKLFNMPATACAGERNWSVWQRVWSNDRNCLLTSRVGLLVYVYFNFRMLQREVAPVSQNAWDQFLDWLETQPAIELPRQPSLVAAPDTIVLE
jgi:hypothetical protein